MAPLPSRLLTLAARQVEQTDGSEVDAFAVGPQPALDEDFESSYKLHAVGPRALLIEVVAGDLLVRVSDLEQGKHLLSRPADLFGQADNHSPSLHISHCFIVPQGQIAVEGVEQVIDALVVDLAVRAAHQELLFRSVLNVREYGLYCKRNDSRRLLLAGHRESFATACLAVTDDAHVVAFQGLPHSALAHLVEQALGRRVHPVDLVELEGLVVAQAGDRGKGPRVPNHLVRVLEGEDGTEAHCCADVFV